jgi:hypothetical protein
MSKYLLFIYWFLTFVITIFSYLFIDQNLIYFKQFYTGFYLEYRVLTTCIYIFVITLLFIIYFFLMYQISQKKMQGREIKLFIIAMCCTLLFAYPAMLSYDIFNYIATAKVTYFYRENPYIIMPVEFTGDPLLLFTHAANKTALYGPVWILLTWIPFIMGAGIFVLTLFSFKLLVLLCYIATLVVIWKLSKSWLQVWLFGLNPLVVIETLVSGHNDIVMILLVLLSYYMIKTNRIVFSLIFFIFSIFIKYATIFLLPVFIYLLFRAVTKREIAWEKIHYVSAVLMLLVFFLSAFRVEIYPWYALWFLPFICFVISRKYSMYVVGLPAYFLMLRYTLFMATGNHFGITPLIKTILLLTGFCLSAGIYCYMYIKTHTVTDERKSKLRL